MPVRRPRYAPRDRYRTRPSAREVPALHDLAATALDRPLVDLPAARRRERARTRCLPSLVPLVLVVLGRSLTLGSVVGATLACL